MKRFVIIIATASLLSACDQPRTKALALSDPVGRYQMLPGPDGKVYVLDSRDGWLRLCGPKDVAGSIFCGAAADH